MLEYGEKWTAVVNPHSGSGRTGGLWRRAEALLRGRGIDFEVRLTEREVHADRIASEAAGQGRRRFIAVGGDGTVHEVLGGIMSFVERVSGALSSDFTLAVIPVGSGNDWIKTHNVPLDVEAAVDLIARGSFSMQDVVRVEALETGEVHYMANIGGVGYDAHVCDTVNRWKSAGRHGRLLYIKSLISNFFTFDRMNVAVECDGRAAFGGESFSIAFGNGLYSGGGLTQVPEARIDDGLLDVTVIPRYSKPRILREIPKLFAGKLLTVKGVIAAKCRSVTVRPLAGEGDIVEVDGEIVGRAPVRLDVCPDQIRVLHRE